MTQLVPDSVHPVQSQRAQHASTEQQPASVHDGGVNDAPDAQAPDAQALALPDWLRQARTMYISACAQ